MKYPFYFYKDLISYISLDMKNILIKSGFLMREVFSTVFFVRPYVCIYACISDMTACWASLRSTCSSLGKALISKCLHYGWMNSFTFMKSHISIKINFIKIILYLSTNIFGHIGKLVHIYPSNLLNTDIIYQYLISLISI